MESHGTAGVANASSSSARSSPFDRLREVAAARRVVRFDGREQQGGERCGRPLDGGDRDRLVGEGLGVGALVLHACQDRAEAEADHGELSRAGCSGELDCLDELALRPRRVAVEQERRAPREHGGGPPGVAGRQPPAGCVRVVEHLVGAVTAAKSPQDMEAGVAAPETARRRVGPVLRIGGATSEGVQPRCRDAEVGMGLDHVLVAQDVEPLLERVQRAAPAGGNGQLLGERRDVGQGAGGRCMLDRLFDRADLCCPLRRDTVQRTRLVRP